MMLDGWVPYMNIIYIHISHFQTSSLSYESIRLLESSPISHPLVNMEEHIWPQMIDLEWNSSIGGKGKCISS
jgi:hypothetical protein